MDSIYYVLIIIGISFGLIVLYIILRGMNVIGAIPILSDIVDPILFGQEHSRMTMTSRPSDSTRAEIIRMAEFHFEKKAKKWKIDADVTVGTQKDSQFRYEPKTGDFIATGLIMGADDARTGNQLDADPDSRTGFMFADNLEIHGNLETGKYKITRRENEPPPDNVPMHYGEVEKGTYKR